MEKNKRRAVSANVFLYRVAGGIIEYLVMKRVPRTEINLPGFWQCVSGALEQGENFEMAARREVFEETGFLLKDLITTGLTFTYPIKNEWRILYGTDPSEVVEQVFVSKIQGQPILSDEHCAFEWLPYQQAYQRLTFGNYQPVIQSINQILLGLDNTTTSIR